MRAGRLHGNTVRRWAFALYGIAVLLTGCAPEANPELPVSGHWSVIGWWAPGVSARTEAQAAAWIGTPARYEANEARFGEQACRDPAYRTRHMERAAFIDHFRAPPETLGVDDTRITLVELICREPGPAPGRMLILKSRLRMITLWDGIFYELARDDVANPLAD